MPVSAVAPRAPSSFTTGPQRVQYLLTAEQVSRLPEEQRNAFKLLTGLANQQDVAGIRDLKRWAGVGNPAGTPAGHEAIGPETLAKVAAAMRSAGQPLTKEHVNEFKANRKLTCGSELGPTTAKALLAEARRHMGPPDDYTRVSFRGVTLNRRTVSMLEQAEATSARLGGPARLSFAQGSYHAGVSKSGHTHDGGGAVDISVAGTSSRTRAVMVRALREAGFAAWSRGEADGMSPHIHAIAIGDRQATPQAKHQVWEYFNGGDGLVGDRRDGNRDLGRPIPAWAWQYSGG